MAAVCITVHVRSAVGKNVKDFDVCTSLIVNLSKLDSSQYLRVFHFIFLNMSTHKLVKHSRPYLYVYNREDLELQIGYSNLRPYELQ